MKSNPLVRGFASGKRYFSQWLAGAVIVLAGVSSENANAATVYAIADLDNNTYQFGSFDLTPTSGSEGNYLYSWTSLGAPSSDALKNLTIDGGGNMYAMHGFGSAPDWKPDYKPISTTGGLGPASFTVPSAFGMAYNAAGELYSVGGDGESWLKLNPTNGATLSTISLSTFLYSQFGGNLAAGTDGSFYFANGFFKYPGLYSITTSGDLTLVDEFSGTDFEASDWQTLFQAEGAIYMINQDRLYSVNLTNAELTKLGTVTDLPANFGSGFTGAVAYSPIPEPASTLGTAALLASGLVIRRRNRRR